MGVDLMFTPAASTGGFCVDPGDCICRSGYSGDLCLENANSKQKVEFIASYKESVSKVIPSNCMYYRTNYIATLCEYLHNAFNP